MTKSGEKLISFLILLSILLSVFLPVQAMQISDRVWIRLDALGLMEGYEDGSLGEEDELTRAQMAMIAARILHVDQVSGGICRFTDVAADYWARGAIETLSHMGILDGVGDNTFAPERNVSFSEAIKIFVSVLGYEEWAENAGGYPYGYLSQAAKLGILKSAKVSDGAISRGEVAQILYDALNVPPMGNNFLENYPRGTNTLYEILTDRKDLILLKGILTETENISMRSEKPTAKEGQIFLDDHKLFCDVFMDQYIGHNLTVYVYLEEDESNYRVKRFFTDKNTSSLKANAEDIDWIGSTAVYYNEAGKRESIEISDEAKIIYNGRLADIPAGGYAISYGSYVFVDQDGNDEMDVLIIHEAQSFIIDKVNVSTQTVYFRNRATLNGKNAIVLDSGEERKTIILTDTEENILTIDRLNAGDGITIFESMDESYIHAVVSRRKVEGVITQILNEEFYIDSKAYKLAKKPDGSSYLIPKIGEGAVYTLDMYGNVIDSESNIISSYMYAYVIDANRGNGLNQTLSLRTITGLKPKKEVITQSDVETISYYFQNDLVKVYECEPTLYIDGERVNASSLKAADFSQMMVAFVLNEDGKVNKLYTKDTKTVSFPSHEFNAKILSFGGESLLRGYATDANTAFICIPNTPKSIDDYYVQVKIKDNSTANRAYGTAFFMDANAEDPDAEPVNILLLKAEMDSSAAPPIQLSSDICIVGDVAKVVGTVFDDADSLVYKITLLNGEDITTEVTSSSGKVLEIAAGLRKGDLIRYVKDGFDRVVNISKLLSVQGLGNEYSKNIYVSSGVESAIYGQAYHVLPNVYDYYYNQMVDRLQLTYSRDDSASALSPEYRLFHENAPFVYKYDRSKGYISPGIIEDICCFRQVGESADKILAILESNDIKGLVIITD